MDALLVHKMCLGSNELGTAEDGMLELVEIDTVKGPLEVSLSDASEGIDANELDRGHMYMVDCSAGDARLAEPAGRRTGKPW